MPLMGTMQSASMRMAAEKPASASEPKLLTTDCTSIMPIETVDCCRMDGSEIFAMGSSSRRSNAGARPGASRPNCPSSAKKDSTAEIPCAISVAHATPATPISNCVTSTQSSATLNTEEKIRKYSGMRDLPSALNMADSTLYMNSSGRPRK